LRYVFYLYNKDIIIIIINTELYNIFMFQLVSFFTSRGQLHDALLVAQVACEAGFPILHDKNGNRISDLRKNDLLPKLKQDVSQQSES